jgi:ABC-type antimicrobial peptide transport system permease subunit
MLASIGIFGRMSYPVALRTNEMGIRLASGAQPGEVLYMVLRESLSLVFAGVGQVLRPRWRHAVAGYLPARRAARVDPLVALRYQ